MVAKPCPKKKTCYGGRGDLTRTVLTKYLELSYHLSPRLSDESLFFEGLLVYFHLCKTYAYLHLNHPGSLESHAKGVCHFALLKADATRCKGSYVVHGFDDEPDYMVAMTLKKTNADRQNC